MHAVEAFSLGRDVHPQAACFLLLQTSPEEKVDNLCKSILVVCINVSTVESFTSFLYVQL